MSDLEEKNNYLVVSYLNLRRAIGIIGILLPFVLALGKIILDGRGIESSISSYYYTIMRDVFVGSLTSIAVFLMSYRGYQWSDEMAGKFAGLTAIGTALLPTSPEINPTVREIVIGHFHILFAASFFLTLAYFSLVLFRKTDSIKPPTQQKMKRNIVYTICGIGIITSVVLIVLLRFLPVNSTVLSLSPIFWLESLAIIFFGISWFVKGETILKDN